MDRTLRAPYKAEEKELSEILYKNLKGLMLIYPPSDEFKKYFANDMFIKANPQAFFQVIHYLFRIHDAAEFKKRFYWPISDKRGEAHFRSATVDYLKFLNDKHNLNWNIKSYLVQIPGGMKFIVFLLDLVNFIIKEQVRLREKQLGVKIPAGGFPEHDLKRMHKKHEFFKSYIAEYIADLEQLTTNLRNKTQLIKNALQEFESGDFQVDKQFIQAFEESNEKLFENHQKLGNLIISIEKPTEDLISSIEKYQKKSSELRKDKNALQQILQKMHNGATVNVTPTMNNVLKIFLKIYPDIENFLYNIIQRNSNISSEATTDLMHLKEDLEHVEKQIISYQKKLIILTQRKEACAKESSVDSNALSKYVCTPVIKVNNQTIIPNSRLPLLGDLNGSVVNLDRTLSERKDQQNTSLDTSFNLSRSQIMDPLQLLRTIYKETTKKKNISQTQSNANMSLLSVKWKERQQLFSGELLKSTPIKLFNNLDSSYKSPNTSQHPHIDVKISSPKTPFNTHSGDITRIALSSSFAVSTATTLFKSPVVKKVQDDALNIKNLSTSPTGRLDTLYSLNDSYTNAQSVQGSKDSPILANDENNGNSINTPNNVAYYLNEISNENCILDTSDTVLKDIL